MTYLEAIIQHFGLPAGRTYPHMGAPCGSVALMIQLSAEDHGAIGRLMCDDVMQVAVSGKVETNDIVREVQHVDIDEPEAEGIPPHVWLYRNMLTDLQAVAPLGRDETNGQYAVAIDDLTDEQRAIPHVSRQLPEPEKAFYPPVPYEHFWMYKGSIPSRFMHGKDLVFWGDEVAYPWADMQETARIGRTPEPATLPENNT